MKDLELWGGPECTINRVGDDYSDQFVHSGHYGRDADLDLIADLGVSAVRYPILWERIQSDDGAAEQWGWHDARLGKLASLGMRPIAGLVHHGSGPRDTSLVAPGFAPGLAAHARAVAERYPWIEDWTPVNEPVTTARFSALYGHWYPHHRDETSFWLAVLNQIDGVRLSMRAIRAVNPAARLVQTEDLGRTYATAKLREQAAFDNVRRWASWDLLFGRVTKGHPFWERLNHLGFGERLRAIADDPCPPDVIGINHYLTSDRFLDHRTSRYPATNWGANSRTRYADVEAIRVLDPPPPGLAGTIREAWHRYQVPVAITEVHNGCTRDEQMRWLADAWDISTTLRSEGIPVEAVTAWALFGSAGWNTLLTERGHYEIGAYDVSTGVPRATGVVALLKGLTSGAPRHPAVVGHGWWRRPLRILHPTVRRPAPVAHFAPQPLRGRAERPILVVGAGGIVGRAVVQAAMHRDLRYVAPTRGELDLTDWRGVAAALDRYEPWAVVNATATDSEAGLEIGAMASGRLAQLCGERDIATVHLSNAEVFDGLASEPYVEADPTSPTSANGISKALLEALVTAASGTHLIVRTTALFSAHNPHCAPMRALQALSARHRFAATTDEIVSPTYLPLMVDRLLDLMIDGETGTWHLANDSALSCAEFAAMVAAAAGLDAALIDRVDGDGGRHNAALASARGASLGPLEAAVTEFLRHAQRHRTATARAASRRVTAKQELPRPA